MLPRTRFLITPLLCCFVFMLTSQHAAPRLYAPWSACSGRKWLCFSIPAKRQRVTSLGHVSTSRPTGAGDALTCGISALGSNPGAQGGGGFPRMGRNGARISRVCGSAGHDCIHSVHSEGPGNQNLWSWETWRHCLREIVGQVSWAPQGSDAQALPHKKGVLRLLLRGTGLSGWRCGCWLLHKGAPPLCFSAVPWRRPGAFSFKGRTELARPAAGLPPGPEEGLGRPPLCSSRGQGFCFSRSVCG